MKGVVVKGLTTKEVQNEKEALNLFFEVRKAHPDISVQFLLCYRER